MAPSLKPSALIRAPRLLLLLVVFTWSPRIPVVIAAQNDREVKVGVGACKSCDGQVDENCGDR